MAFSNQFKHRKTIMCLGGFKIFLINIELSLFIKILVIDNVVGSNPIFHTKFESLAIAKLFCYIWLVIAASTRY